MNSSKNNNRRESIKYRMKGTSSKLLMLSELRRNIISTIYIGSRIIHMLSNFKIWNRVLLMAIRSMKSNNPQVLIWSKVLLIWRRNIKLDSRLSMIIFVDLIGPILMEQTGCTYNSINSNHKTTVKSPQLKHRSKKRWISHSQKHKQKKN